ncbi:ABC-type multidrug transport system, ATPase and permease component [Geosmithia morbida]|uniref:ABC-type multidrug transport system, ATPase and permease component n=1 Tax=Geosmithia morbida TaxID=1094350 RepID=A0A9P4YRT7_9HYPO|nr:ABC-type multidrug transport system, ATPase and permease component [Geosmithia morbida]KAF4120667.1 ABC-type multidrug transport system, ATPase and permease component [Geosmithia morbida]
MGFAQCEWPIWQIDDFTSCFQLDYLKVLLPLIAVGLSLAHLTTSSLHAIIANRAAKGYTKISADDDDDQQHDHTRIPPDELAGVEEEEQLEINAGRLALAKTTTRGSVVQADTPPGIYLSQIVEAVTVAGLIATNSCALASKPYIATHGYAAAVTGILVWSYVLVIVTLRLTLGRATWRLLHLWNHTATLYGLNFLFDVFILRSVIIHPPSKSTQVLSIVEFALVSLLFGLAVTTRRGNSTVLLEWEDGIEPSREPLASLFSVATFSWVDAIIWKGWKQPLEIEGVWNLLPKDKAAAVLSDYRQLKKTTSLALHLLKYFKASLVVQCILAAVSGLFAFAPTLLLKAILEYVEKPERAPKNVLWLYVIGLPVLDLVRSWGDNTALWIGRRICIRVRAIIVGEIYAKALRRKAAGGGDKVLLEAKPTAQDSKSDDESAGSKLKRALGLGKNKKSTDTDGSDTESATATATTDSAAKPASDAGSDDQANLGTIINLMSVDSFKVAEITAYLHFLCASAPAMLVISVVLLWQVMGYSAIPGIVVMALLLPVNYLIGKGFNETSKNIMAATDKRISITNEVLQNIRIIKYFAWEERFGMMIDEKRHAELRSLRSRFLVWAAAVATWNFVPVLITFFSFLVYTVLEKKPLYPSVAFTAMSLFMLLRIPLDQFGDMFAHVQEAKVSIDRVEEFLQEEETEKYAQLGSDNVDEKGVRRIGFRHSTLIWGARDAVADDGTQAFRLLDLDIDFKIGKLNIIAGPTGSGKTSMLLGLLGEMTMVAGRVFCPGGQSREDAREDPETGLTNTIAYVAQSAWLINANIRDNILFAAPFDEQRYRDVIVACALERDLEILDHGDRTLVGDKGITLSGGQKQRISLARALYSNSAHVLMDDCLSAVDSHTAQWIFSNCVKGPLMNNRTCILVTHNLQLCAPSSDYIVLLENGRVDAQGPSKEVIASGKLGEEIQRAKPASAAPSRVPSRVPSSVGEEDMAHQRNDCDANGSGNGSGNGNGNGNGAQKSDAQKKQPPPQQDAMDEGKVTGAVKWPVMKIYLTAMGSWWFWVTAIIIFNSQQLTTVAIQAWVREWANQYIKEEQQHTRQMGGNSSPAWAHALRTSMSTKFGNVDFTMTSPADDTTSAASVTDVTVTATDRGGYNVNIAYYLFILGLIGLASAGTALLRDLWVFFGSLTASRRLHDRLIRSVMRARFKFFDVTPLGQLMNRFSKDMEAIDQDIAPTAISVMTCALSLVVTVVLITVITPGFLIAAVFIGILFYLVAAFYLRASRDLKRLESVHRSPLFQQFGETLSGMTTIRAYGEERRFIRDNLIKVNTQSRPFIYLWACNRWLALRADILGDLVAFFAGVFIILSLGKIDAGAAGISLTYAMNFTENLLWLVRCYAINEQNMNSMERIKEYLDVEQEADEVVDGNRPPPNWPSRGAVEFVDYSTRYRADLEPVLRGVSLKINPREKVGIVGRTGAGKSSLTLAMFRALEADSGRIVIDDVDISTIGLRDLRSSVTIVPQDPTLFQGTIRTNLDPFEQYTDDDVFAALRRVQLIGPDEVAPTTPTTPRIPPSVSSSGIVPALGNKNIFLDLSSPVSESGSNLSQGQRQLLCLARAMLKNPTVLVMDEATASIDYVTDAKIQETIRELTGTVVTIAHRLQTIVDYDKVLVLDKGEVMEFAHPWELISNEDSLFRSMCETSGDLDALIKAAKGKWDEGRLVDDE